MSVCRQHVQQPHRGDTNAAVTIANTHCFDIFAPDICINTNFRDPRPLSN